MLARLSSFGLCSVGSAPRLLDLCERPLHVQPPCARLPPQSEQKAIAGASKRSQHGSPRPRHGSSARLGPEHLVHTNPVHAQQGARISLQLGTCISTGSLGCPCRWLPPADRIRWAVCFNGRTSDRSGSIPYARPASLNLRWCLARGPASRSDLEVPQVL
eukprot:47103-Pyramimonas_sp.AAC.1